jgi:heavy metal translocating P-type ATPase
MLLEMTGMISVYFGIRIYENYKGNRKNKIVKKNKIVTGNNKKSLSKIAIQPIKLTKKDNVPQTVKINHDKYLTISVVGLGISIIKPFVYQPVIVPVYLGLFIHSMLPIYRSAEKQIQDKKIGLEVLITCSSLLGMALSQYSGMQLEGVFYYLGHKLVSKAEGHSKKIFTDIFKQLPSNVWVLRDNVEIEMPLEDIAPNDIIVVTIGEIIAIDGLIIKGMAIIDQHALTGESQPVEKQVGEKVLASTVVISGKIWIKVEHAGKETVVSQVSQILNHAAQFKTQLHLRGEEWSHKAVVPFMGISFMAYFMSGPMGALVCLTSHFGSRFRLIAPLGTLNYLEVAIKKGILVKDGRALEKLNQIDTLLFDKTGTLTQEIPEVGKIMLCDIYQEDELLSYAAIAEQKLKHPIAKAIVNKAKAFQLDLPEIEDSKYQIGYGVTVTFDDQIIQVGSQRFIEMEGISIPEKIENNIREAHHQGNSIVLVALNHRLIGAIEIQVVVRSEVKQLIRELRQNGVKYMAIVSGDQKQPTQRLAEQLGMDAYFYEVLPQDKAKIVEQLQEEGKYVCFVGDGINDTIAMKKADISISLTGASSIATDVAQIVLMEENLYHIVELLKLSRNLEVNLKTGFNILLIPSIIGLGGVFLSNIGFMTVVVLKNLFFLAGTANAMLPLKSVQLLNQEKAENRNSSFKIRTKK